MVRSIATGKPEPRAGARLSCGFTLIELLVVLAIVALLLSIAAPRYFRQYDKARETVLRHNLETLRRALDDYRDDRGESPATLDVLVTAHYLKTLPLDPVTGRNDTWRLAPGDDSRPADVHSGATGRALDGSAYASW
ncbi:type II secretion system protein G [Pandoraea pnomenusa]|uniref:PilD-dependent protein pddA n=1 Tax=Pandoraea pnomenusa TaxID=93220 RepID=A0A378YQ40_9BURK|nr:prepilin-type N-terminal cleavage/methylation domain-containing protein [Pandoraea pnomenusa]AHN75580.1 type II secretion system protein G [Pandoraea pnomenusa]AIU27838.2 type II secretion system protein G [Pandoraea pnomenusa]MBN9095006.1 prepilin-type N-terminal cleavage/methylation domain-containing protein [Pandoraea pnomenusa]QDX19969.1 prepilin-type N-terminal cleavage/methylation domain-containing protein [Pandoraea pnomenusa]SUA79276.1 PilD-dependent protein pddA [Pandoraea pnomenus